MPNNVTFTDPLLTQCEQIWNATRAQIKEDERIRKERPVVKIWDGEYHLQFLCQDEYKFEAEVIDNETGTALIDIPFESPTAQWINQEYERVQRDEGKNVHMTYEYCGIRNGYRLDNRVMERDEDGIAVLHTTWLHDYEELKWYQLWSNPFLLAAVQIPRVFILIGPARWVLLTALFLNILRDQLHLWSIPDDPLDVSEWFDLSMNDWPIVVEPLSFLDDMEAGTLWTWLSSRWKTWHDVAAPILEDCELSVRCRRWLEGDDDPWPGANLRSGALIVSIVDQSGNYIGTSHGGTLFDGLFYTIGDFAADFIETTYSLLGGMPSPDDYYQQGFRGTHKTKPWVIYREGDQTGIDTSEFIAKAEKGIQINTGGHSMPGVNEAISAAIQAIGDVVGNALQIGSIGGSVDALLKPIYEDTILAWMSVKLVGRSSTQGWARYFEYFQDGADKAYTLSSLLVLRAGIWATRGTFGVKLTVRDGAPYMVGEQGLGDFTIGDRIGATIAGDPTGRIFVDRVTKLKLAWDRDNAPEWEITIGDDKELEDPVVKAFKKIQAIMTSLHDLGVF
ncbi:minor tail protein [Gordonia phage Ronaldo]|uniref:Minor tail protein n=4 Tax=Ronaldovirus TaxID=2733205 RepID=A0A6B9LEG0_9CAUD|nr:minor tail protein [Gordonia phage Fryberger]YP_009807752.1 minor tail protein [Gordonia phage Ronaldo]QDH48395.1 minor tail protein [Gordonia phage Ziko]QHB38171.1 minor tail protein [Gordonia phage Volt]QTF81843.1 minor tail protein [Gordonia phage Guey18]AXN53471.1 minor tail protein [Gordonia phage Fryberger]AXN53618.1 minor tail protein [Gordonia phage Ronaldo]